MTTPTPTPTPNARTLLLAEAETLVNGDRDDQYGDPRSDFTRTAAMWTAYLGADIQPHDVAALMALLKLSRIRWSPGKRDSWCDLAGYAACGWDVASIGATEAEVTPDDEYRRGLIERMAKIGADADEYRRGLIERMVKIGADADETMRLLLADDQARMSVEIPFGIVDDGFGSEWVRCKADCGIQFVRPGKVQCECDFDDDE